MLFDQCHVLELLGRVVQGVTSNHDAQEDLMQEAMIHLWHQEVDEPGNSPSWYLQNCRFHLIDLLKRDHSIDSLLRANCGSHLDGDSELSEDATDELISDESPFASVCAHDIMELLAPFLIPLDQIILGYLGEGFAVHDIAQRLSLSHQVVSKHRRTIAALAIHLGISPPPTHAH